MLFKYNYINHEAEKLHELAKHIVIDVWCKSQGKNFTLTKIKEEDDFRKKVKGTPVYLEKPIHKIFKICSKFDGAQIAYIEEAFNNNNKIEELCKNTISPIFYEDLETNTSKEFSDEVKSFFNNLYEKVFKGISFDINKHYNEFFKINKRLCPFCGLKTLEKDSSNHRDDYDHYLPKDEYPFNAVNLKNLLPMCSDCNKKWKKIKNPIKDTTSKKAFYYYSTTQPEFEVEVEITNSDLMNFDAEIKLNSNTMQDEVDTWNRLFSLSRRYRDDFVCHEEFGISWIKSIYSKKLKADTIGKPYDIDNEIWGLEENLIANKNFLKIPFFNACKEKSVI